MQKRYLPALAGAVILVSAVTWAETPGQIYMNSGDIKWGDAPPVFAKGAKMAVLIGDPGKEGNFVARLSMPANYRIAPHWHSQDEDLTIVSGTFYLAEGDKMETAHAHAMKAGAFHHLPAKTHHYAYTKGPTVVQVNGKGPFDLTYVDPKDDPGKAAPAAEAPKKK
jgi:hypothetical protein